MLFSRVLPSVALGLLLAGCNAANVQPQTGQPDAEQAMPESPAPRESTGGAQSEVPARAVSGAQISNQIDQLSGRLVLMQEQLIQLKNASQQQAEMNQILLARLQHLSERTSGSSSAAVEGNAAGEVSDQASADIDAAIGQLMQTVNQLGLSEGGDSFAVASAYTAKGAWVLIRYRVDTGETWLADQGSWVLLEEERSLPVSSYAIELQRADQDLKGFVAVRIDRQSGESWWLNDRRWQVYQ
ncbi:MAG: hypothetical protein GYB21_08440 [Oceanospirillales bacterium]|nr:hypothetical protein [Oceanospirillales bacterium]